MRTMTATMHALQAAIRDGTYRPEVGALRSMEAALRRMTPDQLERLRHPWPSLGHLTPERLQQLRQPAVLRLLTKTVEER